MIVITSQEDYMRVQYITHTIEVGGRLIVIIIPQEDYMRVLHILKGGG